MMRTPGSTSAIHSLELPLTSSGNTSKDASCWRCCFLRNNSPTSWNPNRAAEQFVSSCLPVRLDVDSFRTIRLIYCRDVYGKEEVKRGEIKIDREREREREREKNETLRKETEREKRKRGRA